MAVFRDVLGCPCSSVGKRPATSVIPYPLSTKIIEADNKEMIEETIAACINELIETISNEEAELEEKITGQRGMGF